MDGLWLLLGLVAYGIYRLLKFRKNILMPK